MKATQSTTEVSVPTPAAAGLKAKKDALVRGESKPSRVFRIEKMPDGTFSRIELNPETQRRKSAKAWEAKSEVAKELQQVIDEWERILDESNRPLPPVRVKPTVEFV